MVCIYNIDICIYIYLYVAVRNDKIQKTIKNDAFTEAPKLRLDGLPGPAWTRLDLDPLALAQLRAAEWSAKTASFAAARLPWLLIRLLLDFAWLSWGHCPAVNCATTFSTQNMFKIAPPSYVQDLATCLQQN